MEYTQRCAVRGLHRLVGPRRQRLCTTHRSEQEFHEFREGWAQQRENRQAKALLEFFGGERIDPRIEEDIDFGNEVQQILQLSNILCNEYREGRRLHPFADGSPEIQSRRDFYVESARRNPHNEYAQARPTLWDETIRRQAEADSTDREITAGDQALSLRAIEEERPNPIRVQAPDPEIPVPVSFPEWTTSNDEAMADGTLSAEYALQTDVRDYQEYLSNPIFGFHPLTNFNQVYLQLRYCETRCFDFTPSLASPWHTQLLSFRDWSKNHEPEARGSEPSINWWDDLIASYALYLEEQGTDENLVSFIAVRENLAINDRRELNGQRRRDHRRVEDDWEPLGDELEFEVPIADMNHEVQEGTLRRSDEWLEDCPEFDPDEMDWEWE